MRQTIAVARRAAPAAAGPRSAPPARARRRCRTSRQPRRPAPDPPRLAHPRSAEASSSPCNGGTTRRCEGPLGMRTRNRRQRYFRWPLAANDQRRLIVLRGPINASRTRPRIPGRSSLLRRLRLRSPRCGGRRVMRRLRDCPSLLAFLQVRGDQVADRHVEVEKQPYHEQQREHRPGSRHAQGPAKSDAHAVADHSPTFVVLGRLDPAAGQPGGTRPERERHERRSSRRHPALRGHGLHPQHQREPGQEGRRKGDPPSQQVAEQVVPRPHDRAGVRGKEGDRADDGKEDEHERQQLARNPPADADRGRRAASSRGAATAARAARAHSGVRPPSPPA